MPETKLPIERLTAERFAPFGQAIVKPGAAPTSHGKGWDCWFDVGRLAGNDLRIGQVVTRRSGEPVAVMERHPDEEFLLPVDGPLIQVVASGYELAACSMGLVMNKMPSSCASSTIAASPASSSPSGNSA